jgi:hypothetical protein
MSQSACDPVRPRSHSLQFGLRGLLIGVALLCVVLGWVAWELRFVCERQDFLKRQQNRGYTYELLSEAEPVYRDLDMDYMVTYDLPGPVSIPFWRCWLGDDAAIRITIGSQEEEDEARRLFPEVGRIRHWSLECQ